MKKRILLTIPFILSALLIGCGKPDKNNTSVTDTSDYILTDTSERADSNGKLKRTYTFVNSEKEIKILCGGTVIIDLKYTNTDTDQDITVEHILPEPAVFNSDKKIYSNICQREGCGKTLYYADAAATTMKIPAAASRFLLIRSNKSKRFPAVKNTYPKITIINNMPITVTDDFFCLHFVFSLLGESDTCCTFLYCFSC